LKSCAAPAASSAKPSALSSVRHLLQEERHRRRHTHDLALAKSKNSSQPRQCTLAKEFRTPTKMTFDTSAGASDDHQRD
jgi:hypothetical protein